MEQQSKPAARWPLYLVGLMLVAFTAIFLIEFVGASLQASEDGEMDTPSDAITADSYMEVVTALLADADPAEGAALVERYECAACHRYGAANNIAPAFDAISERAATRRPPLTAEAYLYESIMHPDVYIVEGYVGAMPQNYPQRLTDSETGHIIAFLLSPDAH